MNKACVLVAFVLVVGLSVGADSGHADHAGNKLVRGVGNIVTGWVEVPYQVMEETKESNPIMGITLGLARGIGMTVARGLVGAYEVVTFPLPIPDAYEPIIEPENIVFR